MKKAYIFKAVVIGLCLLSTTFGFTQNYFDDDDVPAGKLTTKTPDFRNVHVAVPFGGQVAADLQQRLEKMGAKVVIGEKGIAACQNARPVVCIGFTQDRGENVSSYSTSSNSGVNGGYNNQASFNGTLSWVTVSVTLKREGKEDFDLAFASAQAPAGSSMETIGSSDRRGGGITTMAITTGPDANVGNAVNLDIRKIFDSGIWGAIAASKLRSPWRPGSDLRVAKTFAKN